MSPESSCENPCPEVNSAKVRMTDVMRSSECLLKFAFSNAMIRAAWNESCSHATVSATA